MSGERKLLKRPEDLKKIKDRHERLLTAMLDNRERFLNNNDFVYLKRVKQAFGMLSEGQSEIQVRRKLQSLGYNQSYKIVEDTKYIFADLYRVNPQFERIIQRERILRHIERAKEADPVDYKAIASMEKILAKITGSDNHTRKQLNLNMFELPPLQLTEDISVIEDKEQDIEFDDIEILD